MVANELISLKAEVREGYLVSSEMKAIWAKLLEMTAVVLDVCKRHNLRVHASGGSLLGVARHKGIIPWDDDIDVWLPRADYDKLLKILPLELPSHIKLQTTLNSPGYIVSHAKLRYKGTCGIMQNHAKAHMCYSMELFLDIFPLDGVPSETSEQLRIKGQLDKMRSMRISALNLPHKRGKAFLKGLRDRFVFSLHSNRWWYEKRENLLRMNDFDHSELCRECPSEFGFVYKRGKMKTSWFRETIYLPFEGLDMPCPKEYEKVLNVIFGDWRIPVKNVSCHKGVIQIADVPYQKVLREEFGYSEREIRLCEQ